MTLVEINEPLGDGLSEELLGKRSFPSETQKPVLEDQPAGKETQNNTPGQDQKTKPGSDDGDMLG